MLDEFLKKLYDSNNKLSLLLIEAKALADDFNDVELLSYMDKEINGYKIEDGIPNYRKIRGEIVVDIQNVYGELTHKEHPLDFSKLSEKLGFDLDDAFVPDGISFVEASLNGLSGQIAIKPIAKPLVKMLDESFHYSNQAHHLIAAYHKIPTTSLEYVLIKVRQDLIQEFQNLIKKTPKNKEEISINSDDVSIENKTNQKKIFVSYAWEDEEHNSKIISFVEFLRNSGFDASMDLKNSQEEASVNLNKMMIDGIQNSDKVVIVLSKKYKQKADNFEGGVWQELNMIIEEMKVKKNKYIFVYFGYDNRLAVTPTAVLGSNILNLKDDQDENFNSLFSKIKEENIIEFSDVSEKVIEIKKIEIKPFKL